MTPDKLIEAVKTVIAKVPMWDGDTFAHNHTREELYEAAKAAILITLEEAAKVADKRVAEGEKVVAGLNAHVERMQGMVAYYLTPEPYETHIPEHAKVVGPARSPEDRDWLLVNDLIYMLDGPEQRAAQVAASQWLDQGRGEV